ncbi:hypothetical protein RHSIM_Rhsim13G0202900 [Rhododendron simsii]|uniref:Cyclic nucleotide-binding domain-containing protein n=1 Tax=Rhododendron simsii TaxID=118357 RepID=A0A834FZU2_RHOSS|nr:hypothetical protein RHSIM_Rhsim13G0202900 [Rhododendron simsii]
MEAEYFPPRADVILENQTPTDFYVLVSGAVDFVVKIHGHDQVLGKAITETERDAKLSLCKATERNDPNLEVRGPALVSANISRLNMISDGKISLRFAKIHGHDQVLGKAITGEIFGETGFCATCHND